MLKSIAGVAVAAAGLALISFAADAAPPDYCHHYADQALWQYHKSQTIPNCYQGDNAVWTLDWAHHYNWCLGVPIEQAREGDNLRGRRLHECSMAAYGHP